MYSSDLQNPAFFVSYEAACGWLLIVILESFAVPFVIIVAPVPTGVNTLPSTTVITINTASSLHDSLQIV